MIFLLGIILGAIAGFRFRAAMASIAITCLTGPIYYLGIVSGPAMLAEAPSAIVAYFLGALIGVWLRRQRRARLRAKGQEAERRFAELMAQAEAFQKNAERASLTEGGN